MKILINTPRLISQGGVANHYIGLKDFWKEDVRYNPIGKKGNVRGSGIFRLPINLISYIRTLKQFTPDIVVLNPSLGISALFRDMFFLYISKLFHQRVVVFFHGFNKETISRININKLAASLNKCECVLVLADEFAEILKSWGVKVPIYLTTTKVDDKLVKNFNIESRTGVINRILFLARITPEKGIYIALKAFSILQTKYPFLTFHVVGDGPALNGAKKFCVDNNINNVCFLGALSGEALVREYSKADLYLFPTYHAEGMPTSVLEAMAFGLPIITRPVGGVCDFFTDEMGKLIDSLDPNCFASAIELYLLDNEMTRKTSFFNHIYAKEHFLASSVAAHLESIFNNILNDK